MSTDQLSHLSLSAVNALSYAQRSSLDHKQLEAIQGTGKAFGSVLTSSGFVCHGNWWKMAVLMACLKLSKLLVSSMLNA